jgi:hypothetical protein
MAGEAEGSTYSEASPERAHSAGSKWDRFPIRTTLPDEVLRHDISDEELDMLGDTKRGFFHEFMWAAFSGAIGAGPAALHSIGMAYFVGKPEPISGFRLLEIVLFFGFLFLGIFSAIVVCMESKKDPQSLKEKIRTRTRSEASA